MLPLTKFVSCKICGKDTLYEEDRLCDNCWEIMSRLPDFIESKVGREYIENLLKQDKDN
jgi:hypothetical protein